MNNRKLILCVCSALLIGLSSTFAKDKDKGNKHEEKEHKKDKSEEKSHKSGGESKESHSVSKEKEIISGPGIKVVISSNEREIIQKYVSSCDEKKGKSLPPGLQKKVARGGELPPGWQKKLNKGEVMPVEVYKECKALPPELVVKLPPLPKGVINVAIDGKIVRLMEATREIFDVFEALPKPPLFPK